MMQLHQPVGLAMGVCRLRLLPDGGVHVRIRRDDEEGLDPRPSPVPVLRIDLLGRLRRALGPLGSDYGNARLSLLVLALLDVGGRRPEHLRSCLSWRDTSRGTSGERHEFATS